MVRHIAPLRREQVVDDQHPGGIQTEEHPDQVASDKSRTADHEDGSPGENGTGSRA
jgi:hypothetical protein